MAAPHFPISWLTALGAAIVLAACGGDGSSGTDNHAFSATPLPAAEDTNAPPATGNTATDGLNRTNYRRQQMGLTTLNRNSLIDTAAQGHSDYQRLNNVITHEQTPGAPGFTGETLLDRLTAADYRFTQGSYAYGEVIAATGDRSGINAAEDLITAIYHRFVMFEPRFTEAGAGAAAVTNGYNYFTLNFAANGLGPGLGLGRFAVYPIDGQENVVPVFYSDYETPDPVGGRNEVGYPVSIHADINATVTVTSFTIRPRGGQALAAKLLSRASDSFTPASVAALVPLDVLAARTTYEVEFTGVIDGIAAAHTWTFSTR